MAHAWFPAGGASGVHHPPLAFLDVQFISPVGDKVLLEVKEESYKLLLGNKADHLCHSWQSYSNHYEVQIVCYVVEHPHVIRLSEN